MDQILVTKDYQSVPVPKDLTEAISRKNLYNNQFQVNNFVRNHFTVHDDQSNNNNDDGRTHFNDEDNSEDKSYDELDNTHQLNRMESNEIVDQENRNLSTVGSCKSTSTSLKHAGTTSTSTFLQYLCLQHIHKAVITILCLQPSLTVSVHENVLHHLYKDISTVVHLLSSLLASLRTKILQSSLLTSLRNTFL